MYRNMLTADIHMLSSLDPRMQNVSYLARKPTTGKLSHTPRGDR